MTKTMKKAMLAILVALFSIVVVSGVCVIKTAEAKNVKREFTLSSSAAKTISGVETLSVDTAKYKYLAIELNTISSGVTDTFTPFHFTVCSGGAEKLLVMTKDYMTSATEYPEGFTKADYYGGVGGVRISSSRINYLTTEKGYAMPNKVNGSVTDNTVWFTVKKDFNGKVFIYLPDYFDGTFEMSDLKVNTDGTHKPTFTIGDIFFAENIVKNTEGAEYYVASGDVLWFETGETKVNSVSGQETVEYGFNSPITASNQSFLAIDMKIDSLSGTTDTYLYYKIYLKSGETYYNLSLPQNFASITALPEGMTASQFQSGARVKSDRINCYTSEGAAYSVPNKGNASASSYVIKKAFDGTFYIWLGDFFPSETAFDGIKIYHPNKGYIQDYTIRQMYFCSSVNDENKTRIDYTEGKIFTDKANIETNGVKLTVSYAETIANCGVTVDLIEGNAKITPVAPTGYKGKLTVNGNLVQLSGGVYTAETDGDLEIAVNFTAKVKMKITVDGAETEITEGETFVLPENGETGFIGYEIDGKLYFAKDEIVVNSDTTAVSVKLDIEFLGASMRLTEPAGLRFEYSADKQGFDKLSSLATVEIGVVLLPTDLVGDGEELTLDTEKAARTGEISFSDTETEKKFNAVLTEIPESGYGREFAARAFATVTVNGKTTTVYYELAIRSVKSVAEIALSNLGETLEEEQVASLKKFAGVE